MAMNWKQIETSREARLWIGQVIAPVITLVVLASPETREKIGQTILTGARKVKNGVTKTYYKVKSKFRKEENKNPCSNCEYGNSIFDCLHKEGDTCKKGIYTMRYQ